MGDYLLPVRVTKLEAAALQLDEAIWMLFNERNWIATHTVASVAENLLSEYAEQKGIKRLIDFVRPERRDKFRKAIRKSQNFFKHADREGQADAAHAFTPSETHHKLMDACFTAAQVGIKPSPQRELFYFWYISLYPEVVDWTRVPEDFRQVGEHLVDLIDPFDPLNLRLFADLLREKTSKRPTVLKLLQ